MLKLFVDSFWISPYVFSSFVALREKGMPFEVAELSLGRGDQRQGAFVHDALTGRVPAIDHDGFVLAESSAIAEYLDELLPAPAHVRLMPEGIKERARARQIMAWLRSDLDALRSERATHTMFYERATAPLSAEAQASAAKLFYVVDRLLSPGASALFGAWSLVDAELSFMLHRLILSGDSVPEHIARYAKEQRERPSVVEFFSRARQPFVPY